MIRWHDPDQREGNHRADQQRRNQPSRTRSDQPRSGTCKETDDGQRRLEPSSALVTWRPLSDSTGRFQKHSRGMLGNVDVEGRPRKQRCAQDSNKLQDVCHSLRLAWLTLPRAYSLGACPTRLLNATLNALVEP